MTQATRDQIESAISKYIDPYTEKDLLATKSIKDITIEGGAVQVKVQLGYPAAGVADGMRAELAGRISTIDGVASVDVTLTTKVVSHTVQKNVELLKNIKNIIAVASGKGGVGKSTLSVNLALALSVEGASVGILDADIYGPSQPRMLGVSGQPDSSDGKSIEPMMGYGLQSMSIGYLIDEETPMIWRGPMVTQALEQLLRDCNWRDLDYLVIDLPPGTGDTQLTLAQKIPVSGAVIVSTPQDIALLDARKALRMFEKVEVPVLGIVENMSTHICGNCGHEEHIFGHGGGERMAVQYGVPFLGSLPLDLRIREDVDNGRPTVVRDPDGTISTVYRDIARRVAGRLSLQSKDYRQAFPNIVIQ